MKKLILTLLVGAAACVPLFGADDYFAKERKQWAAKSQQNMPVIKETIVRPVAVVEAVKDSAAFQGWKFENTGRDPQDVLGRNFKEVGSVTFDFGRHLTGYINFATKTVGRCQDAPVRLKFFMGELPAEMNTPLDPWKGSLSRAWMQDEVVTIEDVDRAMELPRRVSGRYLRVELLGASPDFDFALDSISFRAVSSAGSVGSGLAGSTPEIFKQIDSVCIATLGECMQTVYEDGPKRDHRLWIGDLYLDVLAGKYTFANHALTRRCLYMIASLAHDDGRLISNFFEHPEPHAQPYSFCLTYSLLYNSTLLEYLKQSGDEETARDLWPVVKRQIEDVATYVGDDGLFDKTKNGPWVWLFFDWRDGLDTDTPMQGLTIFALNEACELGKMLGYDDQTKPWAALADKMKKAAREKLYDKKQKMFVSGPSRQLSVLSQAWMVKAGVLSEKEGRQAIENALSTEGVVMPGTPYATHYLVDAMLRCGMNDRARDYVDMYWGGMVRKGADTFWEAYDPDDDFISPYGFSPVNSACHAWSCTPTYFIRKFPEVFQR